MISSFRYAKTRVKTDSIFYSLFQTFPSIFFELINKSPAEAVGYEFTSCEVKQLAFRLDGLFLPTTNDPEKPFYVVEVSTGTAKRYPRG